MKKTYFIKLALTIIIGLLVKTLSASIEIIVTPAGRNLSDGKIEVLIEGSHSDYWVDLCDVNNDVIDSDYTPRSYVVFDMLPTGAYMIKVRNDQNECIETAEVEVPESDLNCAIELNFVIDDTKDISSCIDCGDQSGCTSDGEISVSFNTGIDYHWTGPNGERIDSESLTNIGTPGEYTLFALDGYL